MCARDPLKGHLPFSLPSVITYNILEMLRLVVLRCQIELESTQMTVHNMEEIGVLHILLPPQQAIRETAESSSAHATITDNYPVPPSTGVPKVCHASHYSLLILNGPVHLMFFILTLQGS